MVRLPGENTQQRCLAVSGPTSGRSASTSILTAIAVVIMRGWGVKVVPWEARSSTQERHPPLHVPVLAHTSRLGVSRPEPAGWAPCWSGHSPALAQGDTGAELADTGWHHLQEPLYH